ncbi:MAG: hypothetical protein QW356_07745 [Candidatus Hadarchaeales archaeon]
MKERRRHMLEELVRSLDSFRGIEIKFDIDFVNISHGKVELTAIPKDEGFEVWADVPSESQEKLKEIGFELREVDVKLKEIGLGLKMKRWMKEVDSKDFVSLVEKTFDALGCRADYPLQIIPVLSFSEISNGFLPDEVTKSLEILLCEPFREMMSEAFLRPPAELSFLSCTREVLEGLEVGEFSSSGEEEALKAKMTETGFRVEVLLLTLRNAITLYFTPLSLSCFPLMRTALEYWATTTFAAMLNKDRVAELLRREQRLEPEKQIFTPLIEVIKEKRRSGGTENYATAAIQVLEDPRRLESKGISNSTVFKSILPFLEKWGVLTDYSGGTWATKLSRLPEPSRIIGGPTAQLVWKLYWFLSGIMHGKCLGVGGVLSLSPVLLHTTTDIIVCSLLSLHLRGVLVQKPDCPFRFNSFLKLL